MINSTGFIGHIYDGTIHKNIKYVVNFISSKFNWNEDSTPHTTFVYLGDNYENININDLPSNINCKLDGFDFIGKSLVCKVSVLDKEKLTQIEQLNNGKYPISPFYHITLGKFNNWKDVNTFNNTIKSNIDSSLINNIEFTLSSLNLISVSQPNKIYSIVN